MKAAADFRAAVEARDHAALVATLAEDVRFNSPAVHAPYEGKAVVGAILAAVFRVFEDFEYTDELDGEGAHALVFRARVGDRRLQGIDILRAGEDGLVRELTVMVRPMTGLQALAEAMGAQLAAAQQQA